MSWNTKHTANRRKPEHVAAPSSEPQSAYYYKKRTIKSATSSHPTTSDAQITPGEIPGSRSFLRGSRYVDTVADARRRSR
eukprot:3798950-Prymnesium_polylepis.1